MNFKYRKKVKQTLAAVLAAMLLTGCTRGLPMVSEVNETKAYTLPQSMIIVATERNRYQQAYTGQIWSVELPDGETFETYLLGQAREFLQEMKLMNLLAKDQEIIITSTEKEEIRKLSEEYYESLTEDDIAYMGVKEDDVRTMYEEYFLSNKVVSELTKDMNLEISDSEAKVITIDQIVLSDGNTAQDVLEQVKENGADFEAIAREYSESNEIRKQLGRGEAKKAVEDAAFSLTAGEISPVVEDNGTFYIFRCVSDYDEDATQARKDNLYQQRKKDAFGQIYNQFKAENPVTFSNDIWDGIKFSIDDKTTTTNFFDLYRKHFPNQ